MQLPQIQPLTVPVVVRALGELGVEHDPRDVRSITIDKDGLALEVFVRTPDGKMGLCGDRIATHTIRVPWEPNHSILAGDRG